MLSRFRNRWLEARISFGLLRWLAIFAALEVILRIARVPEYFFPLPTNVLMQLWLSSPSLLFHGSITFFEAILGFATGNAFAVLFAILLSVFGPLRRTFFPVVIALQAVPLVALAPFIAVWFGTGVVGKVFMAALICYFPAVVIGTNVLTRSTRPILEFAASLGAKPYRAFRHLVLPSGVPAILAALHVSAPLAVIGAIIAEFSGSDRGLGFIIVQASYTYNTKLLFAVIVTCAVFANLIYGAVDAFYAHTVERYGIAEISGTRGV